ncbi:unnamed protein product [Phytophthora lilii]|uniref:Signal peptidase complex catalytic subunit SEC11 n=1 Tax=Phytophthora lilii TaxID=2077276 RepID=A0A9W7CQJ9_9STRA|nr:unnamed protein product [Phytophthora lilii]
MKSKNSRTLLSLNFFGYRPAVETAIQHISNSSGRSSERVSAVTVRVPPTTVTPFYVAPGKSAMLQQQVEDVKRLWANKRQLAHQGLNLAMVVLTALMIWKGLMVFTQSESPVVVVLSGSMEPAFQRGDILYLDNTVRAGAP